MSLDLRGARVLVTGGAGFLGRRIVEALRGRGAEAVIVRSAEHDLTDRAAARRAIEGSGARIVVHAAALVGGIGANRARPAEFFSANASMGLHVLEESHRAGVEKLLVVGTACSYPRDTPVPFREEDLWEGYPEQTNAPYGLAKRMLLVAGQAFREQHGFEAVHVIPTNLYGPGDNFDLASSHVVPAMIRRCVEAVDAGLDEVTAWGSGRPTREFLHVNDAAEGIVRALESYDEPSPLNLGAGAEISIADLATLVAAATGFEGRFAWDASKPDGQPRRGLDGTRAAALLGWKPTVDLADGIRETVAWYRSTR